MKEEKKTTSFFTRFLSSVFLFPIIACILIFANNLVMDITVCVISIIALYEYFNCFKMTNKAKPNEWLGMFVSVLIIFVHWIDTIALREILIAIIPISILILIMELLLSKGEKNIVDVAISL